MKTAATLHHCLPELCSEQSKTMHMASCHTLTAGHCWQVQSCTELARFGTNTSLTTSQSSARPTKHNGGIQWFNSWYFPAAATKMQTRQFKQKLVISALWSSLLETSVGDLPVQVISVLLRGSYSSQHSVLYSHSGNSTGSYFELNNWTAVTGYYIELKFKNQSMTIRRT